jgi:hypothetical protein
MATTSADLTWSFQAATAATHTVPSVFHQRRPVNACAASPRPDRSAATKNNPIAATTAG